jgi:hypothetical protein
MFCCWILLSICSDFLNIYYLHRAGGTGGQERRVRGRHGRSGEARGRCWRRLGAAWAAPAAGGVTRAAPAAGGRGRVAGGSPAAYTGESSRRRWRRSRRSRTRQPPRHGSSRWRARLQKPPPSSSLSHPGHGEIEEEAFIFPRRPGRTRRLHCARRRHHQ